MEKIIIPALDEERMQEVRAGYAKIDKPAANLGKLEDRVVGLAGMIGKDLPDKLNFLPSLSIISLNSSEIDVEI